MLSDKLRQLRREKKLTQNQLAQILNVSNGTIAMWETNKRQPDIETIKKIAKVLEVSTDYLLETRISPPQPKNLDNTIVVFGRGEGRTEYQVSEEQMKALKSLLETMKNIPDEDKF